MRRPIPQPHLTERRQMWHAGAVVLLVAAGITVAEGFLTLDGRLWSAAVSGLFPAVGAAVAWRVGPTLRPRVSFAAGRVFLVLGVLSVAQSVFTWRDTPVGSAMAFHYVIAVVFAAVYFNRREVVETLVLIAALHAAVLFYDGYTAVELLMWTLTMLGVCGSGLVIHAVVHKMHQLSYRDPLTGAANRRAWDLALANAVDEHGRAGQPLSLLLADIDDFKAINDTDGHDAGDRVLRTAVSVWNELVRASDVVARLGGDEFALLLRSCDADAAAHLAELVRTSLQRATGASCSVGVATVRSAGTPTALVAAADAELYAAKQAGRACVRAVVLDAHDGTAAGPSPRPAAAPLRNPA